MPWDIRSEAAKERIIAFGIVFVLMLLAVLSELAFFGMEFIENAFGVGSCHLSLSPVVARPWGEDVQSSEKNTDLWRDNYHTGPVERLQRFDPPLRGKDGEQQGC